ncbi:MAG TPA: hypothetical protein VFG04_06460 [Planctomycetaceae bacterium]|jgi:hypothetical protein|nr:hypothetical protein [Planctomycetaceae bacterium]
MQLPVTTILLATLLLQPTELPQFLKQHEKVITYYYKSPQPELGPVLLKELLEKKNVEDPWFTDHEHVLHLVCAQLGDIAAGKPKLVRKYEAAFSNASRSGRVVVLDALQNCGDRTTLKQIAAWLADPQYDDVRPELQALSRWLSDPNHKHVRDRTAQTPDDLDFLWANFFITGDYAPASRILDVIELPDNNANRVLKGAAVWSMRSNLHQHPKLVEVVQRHAKERSAESQKQIGQLIKASARAE